MRVIGGFVLPRVRCERRGRDVRSMWTFGLEGEELKRASQCGRPKGHRGDCRYLAPRGETLPTPWRTIFWDAHAVEVYRIPHPTDPGSRIENVTEVAGYVGTGRSLYGHLAQPAPPQDPLGPGPGMERDTFDGR